MEYSFYLLHLKRTKQKTSIHFLYWMIVLSLLTVSVSSGTCFWIVFLHLCLSKFFVTANIYFLSGNKLETEAATVRVRQKNALKNFEKMVFSSEFYEIFKSTYFEKNICERLPLQKLKILKKTNVCTKIFLLHRNFSNVFSETN